MKVVVVAEWVAHPDWERKIWDFTNYILDDPWDWNSCLHEWHKFMVNGGKYIPYMEHIYGI